MASTAIANWRTYAAPIIILTAFLFSVAQGETALADDGQDWPPLKDAASFSWASNRLSFPSGASHTNAGSRAGLGRIFQVSPPYAIGTIKLLFVNFFVELTGSSNPERCPGNPKTVDFATVEVGNAVYPVTFQGATSAKIPDCGFVWSDSIRTASDDGLTLPPGTPWYIRSSQSVEAGEALTNGTDFLSIVPRFSNQTLGDGVEYTAEPQMGKRLGGTVAAYRNGSGAIGPAMAIGTGWDGSPVYLIVGDSIGAGGNDVDFGPNSRGLVGYLARGLDDETRSRRVNFVNFALPGTRPQVQVSNAPGRFGLRDKVLHSIPNRPFSRIISQMGQNGLGDSFPRFRDAMEKWWTSLHVLCPTCPIIQTTFLPHAGQTENSFWTSFDGQRSSGSMDGHPSGVRWLANRWLASGSDLPAYVKTIDVTPAFVAEDQPSLWRTLPGRWTLSGAAAGPETSVTLAGAPSPSVGDWYVFEPGSPNAETRQGVRVTRSSDWTIQFALPLAHQHEAGVAVIAAPTGDGTHPGSSLHEAAADIVVQAKVSGVLRR